MRLWSMTLREFNSIKFQWARRQAHEYNMVVDTKGVPFVAEDFMGGGNREQRIALAERSRFVAERANRSLAAITRNTKPEDVPGLPAWALGKQAN